MISLPGMGLVIAALIHAMLSRVLRPLPGLVISVLAGVALAWMPVFGGLGLWQWAVSFLDHISITAAVLVCAHMLVRSGLARADGLCWSAASVFVLFYGLVLYASGFGLIAVDVYDWGYGFGPLYWTAVAGLAAAGIAGRPLLSLVLAAGLLAHLAGVYDSGNLNDCLIDGGLFLFMAGMLIRRAARGLRVPR